MISAMILTPLPSPGAILLAMDRATVRRRDANGFLHVEMSNISKANICPYYGREIPDWQALGLDPDHVYQLLRDPDELARAVSTFNNIPILCRHVPISAEHIPDELVIGSTGTDARFVAPFLQNSLVIWPARYQRLIESRRQKELSCAYRYRADMTPGQRGGLRYDGVMRDIVGNHVALVIEGRAGPDVVVGDEVMKLKSRTALMISGALAAHIRPLLAQDAKVDISTALKGINAKSIAMDGAPKKLADKVAKLVTPHLAEDGTLDADSLAGMIGTIQPVALAEDAIPDPVAAKDDDIEDDDTDGAEDGKAPEGGREKPAMDEAAVKTLIADAVTSAEARTRTEMAAIDQARRDVQPFVGEVVGMDSAASIYKLALDQAKVDLADVPEVAFKAMVAMLPKPNTTRPLAHDAAIGESKLSKIVPNLPKLHRS